MSTHVVIFVCFLAGYRFDFIVLILVIVIFMKVELVFFFLLLLLIQFKWGVKYLHSCGLTKLYVKRLNEMI